MNSEPLIWTTLGNVPISDLQYSTAWEDAPGYVKFVETYEKDGEIVKQAAHVMVKQGVSAFGEQGACNG